MGKRSCRLRDRRLTPRSCTNVRIMTTRNVLSGYGSSRRHNTVVCHATVSYHFDIQYTSKTPHVVHVHQDTGECGQFSQMPFDMCTTPASSVGHRTVLCVPDRSDHPFFVWADTHVYIVVYVISHSEDETSTTHTLETVKQEVYRIVQFRTQHNLCV